MSTYLIKQLRVGCVCFGGEIDEVGADALMALAADEIERRELCEKTSAEQLQLHSERLAEAGRREASLQELTRKLRKCLRSQTYQTSITAKSINNAVNEKLVWHNVVPEGLTLKEHPCEQNVGTCVNHLLDTIADLREATTSWACPYCGEATRDRSSAAMHPSLCEKWPYRLLADAVIEMVRANDALGVMLNNEVNYRKFLNPTSEDTVLDKTAARCEAARVAFEAIAREAADAAIDQKQNENTEGES